MFARGLTSRDERAAYIEFLRKLTFLAHIILGGLLGGRKTGREYNYAIFARSCCIIKFTQNGSTLSVCAEIQEIPLTRNMRVRACPSILSIYLLCCVSHVFLFFTVIITADRPTDTSNWVSGPAVLILATQLRIVRIFCCTHILLFSPSVYLSAGRSFGRLISSAIRFSFRDSQDNVCHVAASKLILLIIATQRILWM